VFFTALFASYLPPAHTSSRALQLFVIFVVWLQIFQSTFDGRLHLSVGRVVRPTKDLAVLDDLVFDLGTAADELVQTLLLTVTDIGTTQGYCQASGIAWAGLD
jgi:hypothetical protein